MCIRDRSVMIASGIDFDTDIFMDQSAQDFVQDILITFIAVTAVLIGAVPYNIVDVSVDIYIGKDTEIFQNRFKIFPVAVRLLTVLKKFAVIRVIAVDYMRRTNDKIERIQLCFLIKSLFQMRLKPVFNPEIHSDPVSVFFF